MKLIDLLCAKLEEWPSTSCNVITQDGNGNVYYWRKTPAFDKESDSWEYEGAGGTDGALLEGDNYFLDDDEGIVIELDPCSDYATAMVKRDAREAAMKEEKAKPEGGLFEWRDRIIAINKEIADLSVERNLLFSAINKAGFKLDLPGMK